MPHHSRTPARVGDTLKLEGTSAKGRRRIVEAGTRRWRVVGWEPYVAELNGRAGYLIRPEGETAAGHDRWIQTEGDVDLRIVAVESLQAG